MTITTWQMYWITRLNDAREVLGILVFLFGLASFFTLVEAAGFPNEDIGWYPEKAKYFFIAFSVFMLSLIINCLLPSTQDMAAILVVPKIVNNQKVQEIPSKLLDLASDWMDALKPKK
jgi:hypothetical protein